MYTRTPITRTHSCVDHLYVKYNNYDKNRIEAGVLRTINLSDHYSTVLTVELDNKLLNNTLVYKMINYSYNKFNEIFMKET